MCSRKASFLKDSPSHLVPCLLFKYKAVSLHRFGDLSSFSVLIKRYIFGRPPIVSSASDIWGEYSRHKFRMTPIDYQERPISSITSKVEVNPTFFDTKPDLWRA